MGSFKKPILRLGNKKGKRTQITYAWEFTNQVEFVVVPAFLRNLYHSGKYTSKKKKKPAKPQFTKTAHSTGDSKQNIVVPS